MIDAAFEAGKRALEAGFVKPLVCFADAPSASAASLNWTFDEQDDYKHYLEVTMLGFLEAAYEPVDVREYHAKNNTAIKDFATLGFAAASIQEDATTLIQKVQAIEEGRRVAKGKRIHKTLGNGDPRKKVANSAIFITL
jgi:leucyl aminopeptidase